MIMQNFEKNIDDEIDEQINNIIFVQLNVDFDVKIKKRDDFDATIEREIISTQNICFFDVAIDNNIDVTNNISKNKIFEIVFDELINNVNIDINSFDEKNIAKSVDNAIDTIEIRFAIIVFDIKKNIDIAIIDFDVNIAISFEIKFVFDAKRFLIIIIQKHVDEYSQCFRYAFSFDLNS